MNPAMQIQTHQCKGLSRLGLNQPQARVLIVGLGLTGLSLVRFLSQNDVQVTVVDSRDCPPNILEMERDFPHVSVHKGQGNEAVFNEASHLIVSPGVSLELAAIKAAKKRGAKVLGDIDVFAVCADSEIACITGSNGKSTVTTLLGEMATQAGLDVRVGGNLGVPALDLLSSVAPDLYILELSSFQLERTSALQASVATVLNISEDHMDRYTDVEAYAQAKKRIFNGDGVVVYNRNDLDVVSLVPEDRQTKSFGLDAPNESAYGVLLSGDTEFLAVDQNALMPVQDLKICGSHNIENALAAMAMADSLSISRVAQRQALSTFEGLEHRMQWVAESHGVRWINDSKATNVGACLAALKGLEGPIVLIAGGDGKGVSFGELSAAIKDKVSALILIGKDADKFVEQAGAGVACFMAGSIEQAVNIAATASKDSRVVLLSPACASLDQFADYQERGDRFMQAVKAELA
jgi:UDP-N-acetylmuramoylalanine--D-glutamate ligase